jgi:UrcA family protein
MKTFTYSFLFAIAAATASTATAEPRISHYERTATVYVADLDLASQADAQALYERIGHAARSICTADELSFDVQKRRHWRECVETAVERAVDRANAALLMAIHLQQREQVATL